MLADNDIPMLVKTLYRLIMDAKRGEAKALLASSVEQSGYVYVLREVVEPALRLVGERWALDHVSLAQGFIAGKVAEDFFLMRTIQSIANEETIRRVADSESPCPLVPRIAVIGNTEDDYHSLGRSMVISFLRLEGWQVEDLGNDVSASEFVEAAVLSGACIIGASAMMLSTAKNIVGIREELIRRNLSGRIQLAVGGAVFRMNPELVYEVGADGTAKTALESPTLFERLRKNACLGVQP